MTNNTNSSSVSGSFTWPAIPNIVSVQPMTTATSVSGTINFIGQGIAYEPAPITFEQLWRDFVAKEDLLNNNKKWMDSLNGSSNCTVGSFSSFTLPLFRKGYPGPSIQPETFEGLWKKFIIQEKVKRIQDDIDTASKNV